MERGSIFRVITLALSIREIFQGQRENNFNSHINFPNKSLKNQSILPFYSKTNKVRKIQRMKRLKRTFLMWDKKSTKKEKMNRQSKNKSNNHYKISKREVV